MNIIAVDDERRALEELVSAIREVVVDTDVTGFQKVSPALAYAETHKVDAAFLDIEMVGMNGLMLAQRLKDMNPRVNIIFVTGYREYTEDAFALHASGYVHKPVSPDAVREQMEILRFTPEQAIPVKEFGPYTFDHLTGRVFYEGRDTLLKPREFQLFSLLANHRGMFFTPEELYQKVWGDDPNGNVHTVYVRVSALRKKLEMDDESLYTIEQKRNKGYRLVKADE